MNDLLHHRLNALHDQTQPDSSFADQLEEELRAAYAQAPQETKRSFDLMTRRTRFYRRLAVIAASLGIVIGLFLTVPPLRSFAEEIMRYFVAGPLVDPSEEEMLALASESVSVDSVAEAEAIAGFDVLEWTAEGYDVFGISASKSFVGVFYGKKYPVWPQLTISLEQHRAGWGNETESIGDDAYAQTVMVDGVEGEYVQGVWFSETGEDGPFEWNSEISRQLRWQKGDMVYRIVVSTEIADTPEEVVALAESLR